MPDIIAETERLILRTIEEGDAAEQDRLLNTPTVMARLGGVKELHEIEAKHAKGMALYATEGFSFLFMIEKATGEMVGHCGIKRVDNPLARNQGDHEIGWLVREDRWRRGYAEEVVALTVADNTPSWGLMRRLGMRRREDLDYADARYDPPWRDTVVYSIDRKEWDSTDA